MNRQISTKPYLLTTGWCCLLHGCVLAASAQSQGHVRLPDLPPTAKVYADSKPIHVSNGLLALPSGWHHIQVERQEKSGLQAYHRFVHVVPNQTAEMRIVWHSVRLTIKPGGLSNFSLPGVAGPSGEPGPSARPYKPLPANADLAALRAPLQEARNILVSDFEAQVDDALNRLSPLETPIYPYVPGPPADVELGDPGSVGPPGSDGIPAEAALIQTSTGVPLQEMITHKIGLLEMQRTYTALQARLQHLSEPPPLQIPLTPESVQILTPSWKTALDAEWRRRKAVLPEQFHAEHHSIVGLTGAPGRRGPDGIAPAGAATVRVSPEQEKQLLDTLTTDPAIHARVEQLRQKLVELNRRVYLAEGLRLEQHPPASTSAPTHSARP